MQPEQRHGTARALQLVLSGVTLIALVWAMLYSGRVAISRIFVKYGTTVGDITAIDSAIGMTPMDAEAHFAHGALSNYLEEPADALKELELAVSLRPHDYDFWLELGMTRDQLGDQAGALFCFNESVRLAPYYALPRWQRGNLLFRKGSYDEAFVDLRRAAASNPDFLPSLIYLAWGVSGNDAQVTEELVKVQSDKGHYALALFFARHRKPDAAVSQFRLAGVVSTDNRRDLVKELLLVHAVAQAYDVWSSQSGSTPFARGTIFDGGFEASLNRDETGFGWRLAAAQTGLSLSIDGTQPQSGTRSLRIDFTGHAVPAAELISQLIPVEPTVRYKLNFASRTHSIVTGGPLVMVVKDANSQRILGQSAALPADTSSWQIFSVPFATEVTSQAVVVSFQRQDCTSAPCPIFGSVNLDSFSLEKLK